MVAALGHIVLIVILIAGATSSGIVIPVAVTVRLTCTADDYTLPIWYLQGQQIVGIPSSRKEELRVALLNADPVGSRISSPVLIDGNSAIHDMALQCRIRGEVVYNTTLLYQDRLPAPPTLNVTDMNGSAVMIEWDPPILQSTELDHVQIRMNPNLLVYSVNITDTASGTTVTVNVTETSYMFTNYIPCHRYEFQVSAWNAAGEGNGTAPTPYLRQKVPANLASGHVTAMVGPAQPTQTRKHQQQRTVTVTFTVRMDTSCQARLPDVFDVRVTRPGQVENKQIPYDHSDEVNFAIIVTGVEDCTLLRVQIRTRNSAGLSAFHDIQMDCGSTDPGTATTPTTTGTTDDTNAPDSAGQDQQGDSTIYIATGVGVGTVVIAAAVALLLVIRLICKRPTKVKSSEANIYEDSPPLGGKPVYQLQAAFADYHPTEPLTVPPTASSPTASPTVSLSSSTDSTDSNTALLQSQAPGGNTQLVYARIDPAKHSRPQPPASDNKEVQYSQIQYQEQL